LHLLDAELELAERLVLVLVEVGQVGLDDAALERIRRDLGVFFLNMKIFLFYI
jgi:hypothetical protein